MEDEPRLTIYLMRHGESRTNASRRMCGCRQDPPLSRRGRQQIERQAERLRDLRFAALYTSPLLRTRETATIIGARCGLQPLVRDTLLEVDIGILDGFPLDDPAMRGAYNEVIASWEAGHADTCFPGGEALWQVQQRLQNFVQSLPPSPPGPLLIVGHSLLFECLFWLYCVDHPPRFAERHMDRGRLSIIAGDGARFHTLSFNT